MAPVQGWHANLWSVPYFWIGWRGRWEGGSGWGIHVNPWLIHVNVWQKPLQYCKVISLQLIKINGKKKNSCPLSWWCHPAISSSVIPFSSCLQSFPASGSFPTSQFFSSGGQILSHQKVCISLLSFSIRGQTDWKPQSQKTNQSDHMDHSLV